MKRKSISDSPSVENISDQILRSDVQLARLMWAPQTQLWIVQVQFRLSCLQFTI